MVLLVLLQKNTAEFADYTLKIFNDYDIWKKLRNNLIELRGTKRWSTVASNLIRQL